MVFKRLKTSVSDYKKRRSEDVAYKRILKDKTRLAERQAYSEEAVKVARERAKQKARAPSNWAIAGMMAQQGASKLASVASGRKATSSPVRRTVRRAPVRRRAPARRYAPVTRRAPARRYAPARRVVRRAPAKAIPQQSSPTTLDHAIYGGY